jgi:hypothetical protein
MPNLATIANYTRALNPIRVGWGGRKDKDQGGGQMTSWLGWRGRHGRVGWVPRRGAVGEGAWRSTRVGEELAERGVTG